MKKELIAHRDPKSPISETFRTLRTNIQFMNTSKKLKTLLITSTSPGEGKSWVSSNLAVTFAQAGKRVVLVDADMRKGRQYTIFGAVPKPGLSNYLSGYDENENEEEGEEKSVAQYIQKTEIQNLCLLAAGNVPPNPAELLISPRMIKLLDELKEICDIVIIDGTPSELVTDSVVLSRLVDSTVIVSAYESTKRENLKRIITNIKNVNGNIAGVVFNKIPTSSRKYEQTYYYGSSTSRQKSKKRKRNINRKINYNIQRTQKVYPMEKTVPNKNIDTEVKPQDNENQGYSNLSNSQEKMLKEINEYIDREKKKLG